MNTLIRFVRNDSGASAIEYAIMAGFIAAVIIAAVTTLGTVLKASYTSTATLLQ
jgi:pilus assembly protein Flp/PilA